MKPKDSTYTDQLKADKNRVIVKSDDYIGFEASEGFNASTTYNNTVEKTSGDKQWNIHLGFLSTSNKLTGDQSMQLRPYANIDEDSYCYTRFDFFTVGKSMQD